MAHWVHESEVQRILRLAFLYGCLEKHGGKVYVPGSPRKPVCRDQVLQDLLERGWLKPNGRDSRFEITDQGRQAEGEFNGLH